MILVIPLYTQLGLRVAPAPRGVFASMYILDGGRWLEGTPRFFRSIEAAEAEAREDLRLRAQRKSAIVDAWFRVPA